MLILLFLNSGAVCGLTADDDKFLLCLTFYLDFLFDSEKIVLLEGVDFRYPENFFIRIEFQGWMLSFCISSSRSLVSLRECIRGLTIQLFCIFIDMNNIDPSIKQYFQQKLNSLADIDRKIIKGIHIDLFELRKKISHEIRFGQIQLPSKSTPIKQLILNINRQQDIETISKRLLLQRQIDDLRRQDFFSEQQFLQVKKQLILKKQALLLEERKEEDGKQKQVGVKVKKWATQNKVLVKKRENTWMEIQKKQMEEEEIAKKKQEEEKHKQQVEKKKAIENKLKEIEDNRIKREEFFKSVKSQSLDRIPYYVQAQKKYQTMLDQKRFEEEINRKQRKHNMKIDHEALKVHQKQYLSRMKEKNFLIYNSRTQSSQASTGFNIFTNRSLEKLEQQKRKRERRMKFQQKINEIPINIDEAKKVEINIAVDRSKNPLKYNFLSQKSLNQFQIYGEFKNFQINANAREHGNGYLQELKAQQKNSKADRNNSASKVESMEQTQRPQYRDYLKQLQIKKKKNSKEQQATDEISKAIRKYKNKQKVQIQLSKKYSEYDTLAQHKKQQIRKTQTYRDVVRKQVEMDQAMSQALKARLALLEIKK